MFQPPFNNTYPSNDLTTSSLPPFPLSRIHQSSQQQQQQQHFHQQIQHRQKTIFPTMDRSPINNHSPEQPSTKIISLCNPSPTTTTPIRFNHTTTPTTRISLHPPPSPPPVTSNPENNTCRLMDYRNQAVAAFTVDTRELICLPQAFELFLKHLVGGLHTVYTKLKRLDVVPVVCNVEQVRVLRSLGAIQPGVNRCKLISPKEFDILYEDCTNSSARPGRPPKRSGNVALANDAMKKQRLQISNDYYQSHHHPSPSSSYLDAKKPPFSHPYFSLAEPKPSLLPSYPINFLPFGHPGFMNFMASHLATGRQLTPSLFDFNASARYNEIKHHQHQHHQQQQSLALIDKKVNNDNDEDDVVIKNKQRNYSPYNHDVNNYNNYNNNNNNNSSAEKSKEREEIMKLNNNQKKNNNRNVYDYSNDVKKTKNKNNYDEDDDNDSDKISSSQQQQQQQQQNVYNNNYDNNNNNNNNNSNHGNNNKHYDVTNELQNGDVNKEDRPLNLETIKKHKIAQESNSTSQRARKVLESDDDDNNNDGDVRGNDVDVINKEDDVKSARGVEAEDMETGNAHVDTPEIVTMEMMLVNMQAIVKMVGEKMRNENEKHSLERENLLRMLSKEKEARKALEMKLKHIKNHESDNEINKDNSFNDNNDNDDDDDRNAGINGRIDDNMGDDNSKSNIKYHCGYDYPKFQSGIPHQVIQSPSSAKDAMFCSSPKDHKYSPSSKDPKYSFSAKEFKYPTCVSTSPLFKIFKNNKNSENNENEDKKSDDEDNEDEDEDMSVNDLNNSESTGEVGHSSPVTSSPPSTILTQLKSQSGQFTHVNGSCKET